MFRELDFRKIDETLQLIHQRVEMTFPESGLLKVCGELETLSSETEEKLIWISRPHYPLRIAAALVIVLTLAIAVYGVFEADWDVVEFPLSEMVQIAEAALNDLILIGAAIFFLVTLEARFKRSKTLGSINDLRAIAHVIDMHQMNKDPWIIEGLAEKFPPSDRQPMSQLELSLYLDFCSELLSVISKMAAIYAQHMPEPEVIAAVNEMEALTSGLSRKIWQKLNIVNQHAPKINRSGL